MNLRMMVAAVAVPLALAAGACPAFAQTVKTTEFVRREGVTTAAWREEGREVRVEARGEVELTADATDVLRLSPGGLLTIIDVQGGRERRFVATRTAAGGVTRAFTVAGHPVEADSAALAWLASILPEVSANARLTPDVSLLSSPASAPHSAPSRGASTITR